MHAGWHILALVLLGWNDGPAAHEIPLVGRPDFPFSEASGRFQVKARAEPTTLAAEKHFTLTLIVTANGPFFLPPNRIDLREVHAIVEAFHVEEPIPMQLASPTFGRGNSSTS